MMQTGGCQCGAVRYECPATLQAVYVCHCTECRRQSASAFGISCIVPTDTIRLLRGEPHAWTRRTASGVDMRCAFCPDCGTRLWHERGTTASVKGGSLDAPPDLADAVHIWTRSKLPGVCIPSGSRCFEGEPD